MKPLKIVFTSDLHIGLRTNEIGRISETLKCLNNIVNHCVKLKKKGFKVILVIGGDVFNTNTPSEKQVGAFLTVLTKLHEKKIKTIVMVGNHDSISDPERLSCLSFLNQISPVYKYVSLVEDIKFMKLGVFDSGPCYATFLPHISQALLEKKRLDGSLLEDFDDDDLTPQEYIDGKCDIILNKEGKGSQHLVFSHLNVLGAHPGSEENLLKKSTVFLPKCFTTDVPLGYVKPDIIQGHIHSNSVIDNINIIGSPIYCTFGESGEKYFAEITISQNLKDKNTIELLKTKHIKFKQLDLDLTKVKSNIAFTDLKKVKKFLSNVKEDCFIKFNITITPDKNGWFDWKKIQHEIKLKHKCSVKDITPRVVFKRVVRSALQKINLDPNKAVKIYVKRNLREDEKKMKRVYKLAKEYL